MKLGLIFECGPQGADKQVCEYLARQLRPGVQLISRTLDNKPNLLAEAGKVTAKLLADGCTCVLIVWDLRPAWPDKKDKPCRHDERQALLQKLAQAGIAATQKVYLVCIEQELESWVLADEKNISDFLSTSAHPYTAKKVSKPDREKNPKSVMLNHFRDARRPPYDDKIHAVKILSKNPLNLKRLRRSASFARFESKLMACGVHA
jgi:hypothetical protein